MFCFISSLRPPAVAGNWLRVCQLFERTAVSVFNQTSPEFRFIVVCHELPVLTRKFDDRLEFFRMDYPVPLRNHHDMIEDKVHKLLAAMRRARALGADFVMPVDADDLVSRRIVAHTLANAGADGWYVENGYQYKYGGFWLERLSGFFRICGTCNILSRRWFAFPGLPRRESAADAALIVGGHHQAAAAFAGLGANLLPLPFPGAVYITRHGENSSCLEAFPPTRVRRNRLRAVAGDCKRSALKLLRRRPCSSTIRAEFALNRTPT